MDGHSLCLLTLVLAVGAHSAGPACFSPDAKIIRRHNLSCGNKQYILDYHNKIRNHVASGRIKGQPKAANMVEMRWNENLAKLAQERADSCLFEHGDLELNGKKVGQNLAIVTSTQNALRLNITQMVQLWYNEVFQFGYNGGFEPNSGHYSQLIWGNTREVGCGYTYYEEDDWYKMYFVCDYYPPGNYINQKPYAYGKYDCKKYGLPNSRKYSKLCAVDNSDKPLCKSSNLRTVANPNNITEGDFNVTMDSSIQEEFNNDTSEEMTTDMTMMEDDSEMEVEENMEDMSEAGTTEINEEGITPSMKITHQPQDANVTSISNETGGNMDEPLPTTTTMTLEETMAVLNKTMTDSNELFPQKNDTVFVGVLNQTTPIKLDWKNKEEFFRAATKLLELLINRQIYLTSQNL